MASQSRGVSIRLSIRDKEVVEKALKELGTEGQLALRKIARATEEPTRGLLALNTASSSARDGIAGLASRVGPAGAVLGALGPAGIAAAAGIGTVTLAFAGFLRAAREIAALDDVAQTLGINVEALQELRFAASESGIAVGTADMALQRFIRRSAEAARGTGEALGALNELGVSARDFNGQMKPAEQLIREVADALQRVPSEADRVRIAFKLFDSEGVAMLRMLKDGSDGLDRFAQDARDLGLVIDSEMVARAAEAENHLGTLAQVMDTKLKVALLELTPVIDGIATKLLSAAKEARYLWDAFEPPEEHSIVTVERNLAELQERATQLRQAIGSAEHAGGGLFDQLFGDPDALARQRDELEKVERAIRGLEARLAYLRGPPDGGPAPEPAQFEIAIKAAEDLDRTLTALEARYLAASQGSLAQVAALDREEKALKIAEQAAKAHAAQLGLTGLSQEELRALVERYLPQARQQVELEGQIAAALTRRKLATEAATAAAVEEEKARADASKRALALIKERDDLVKSTTREIGETRALTAALKISDREYKVVQQTQALLRRDTLLTADAARKLAGEMVDAQDEMARTREAGSFLSDSLTRGFDRIGEAFTQAFATGKRDLLDMGNIGRAMASELYQSFVQLAAINPLKNAVSGGGTLPTLGSVFGGGGTGGGLFSTLGNAKSVWDLGSSLTGGNWLSSALPSIFGATATGTLAGGATAASLGVSAVAGGASNVGVAAAAPLAGISSIASVALPIMAIAAPFVLGKLFGSRPSDYTASFQGPLGGRLIKTEDKANDQTRSARDQIQGVFEASLDELTRTLGAQLPKGLYVDFATGSRDGDRGWLFGTNPDGSVNRADKLFEGKFGNADELTAGMLQEILRRSEGLSENARKVVDGLDFVELGLQRSAELLGFAESFETSLKALSQGALSLGDVIEGQVRDQVLGTLEEIQVYRRNAADAGLDTDRATQATRDYVEILIGLRQATYETLTPVQTEWRRIAALMEEIGPLLAEVGISAETGIAALERAQQKVAGDFVRGVTARGLGLPGGLGEVLAGFRAERDTAAELGVSDQVLGTLRTLRDAGLREALSGVDGQTLRNVIEYYSTIEDNAPIVRAATELLDQLGEAAGFLSAEQRGQIDTQLRATRQFLNEQERIVEGWRRLATQLRSAREGLLVDQSLSPLSPADRLEEARRQFEELERRARLGDQEALAGLPESSRRLLEASRAFHASSEEYYRDFERVQEVLRDSEDLAGRHLSIGEQQLAATRAELDRLDRLVNGNGLVIASLDQANALLAAIAAAIQNAQLGSGTGGSGGGGSGGGSVSYVPGSYGATVGTSGDLIQGVPREVRDAILVSLGQTSAGGGVVQDRIASDTDFRDAYRAALIAAGGTPAFAYGGTHAGGLRLVGERGPELEVTGPARIYSPERLVDMMRSGSSSSTMPEEEIRGLRADVRALQQALSAAIQQAGSTSAETLRREGGQSRNELTAMRREMTDLRQQLGRLIAIR
ncbi:phage tail tape measure protein [Oceanibaculum sp.]|uniref:phage tail tape measure protein n=1 Tax=Oceanibaculum sp. TaxID=1903597 RepID=UPI00258B4681|nr:phage tail tape measure protein [Oceanibaculum sp.]MCH2393095.1 phage tail tape measure protein [Oceanibaculum sp.]